MQMRIRIFKICIINSRLRPQVTIKNINRTRFLTQEKLTITIMLHPQTGLRVSRWGIDEHARFLIGYQMHGHRWTEVCKIVATRAVVQVRSHAQKCLEKLENQQNRCLSILSSQICVQRCTQLSDPIQPCSSTIYLTHNKHMTHRPRSPPTIGDWKPSVQRGCYRYRSKKLRWIALLSVIEKEHAKVQSNTSLMSVSQR